MAAKMIFFSTFLPISLLFRARVTSGPGLAGAGDADDGRGLKRDDGCEDDLFQHVSSDLLTFPGTGNKWARAGWRWR
jgi:hypothetical protein